MRMGRGLGYGENQAVNALQAAAPLPRSEGGRGPVPRTGGASPIPANGVFGPTDRPQEAITAGVDWGAGPGAPQAPAAMLPDDPNMLLRAIVAQVGFHPDLVRLLDG